MKLFQKKYFQTLIAVVGAFVLAMIIELLFQFKLLTLNKADKGNHYISLNECTTLDDFDDSNGTLSLKAGESGTISFAVNRYVDRLVVSYDTKGTLTEKIIVTYKNMYGKEETKEIVDVNPVYIKDSVINIKKNVVKVDIQISEQPYDISINSLTVRNVNVINWIRVMFFFLGVSSIAALVVWRKTIATKVYLGFAIVAGTVGLAMILAMPLVRVGFDEEAHLRNSFVLSFQNTTVENETLWNMLNTVDENHPAFRTSTYEEYKDFYHYLKDNAAYIDNGQEEFRLTHRTTSGMATFAYIFTALTINIARLLKVSFANIYILTRLTTLITYLITMTFAIKIIKKGKMLLAVIGLMPTLMFLATTVSYDPVVMGFTSLGLAFIFNEIIEPDMEISWKNYILGAFFLGFGCLAKAIYAPLFLIGLMYPKTKFKDKKQKLIMKSGFAFCFIVLMAAAILPTLMGQDGGDNRGGDTSHIGQLSYMMSNIFGYFGLLIKTIWMHLQSFTLSAGTIDTFYFFGTGKFIVVLDIILAIVLFTGGEDNVIFKKKQKIVVSLCLLAIVALIWTCMYMAFTEPGVASVINGVQGRYFIPLLFTGLTLFATPKIKCEWNKEISYSILFGIMSFVLCFETFSQIILNSCS